MTDRTTPAKLPGKRAMVAALRAAGWNPVRVRGEPLWFVDPYGYEVMRLRLETAYELMLRRQANN